MTCREKLEMEYPEDANIRLIGDCPDDYGYAGEPKYCKPFVGAEECERCWNREVEEKEKKEENEMRKEMTVEELVKVLDKSNGFYVRECHSGKTIFEPNRKDKEIWEEVKKRSVVQVTACAGEFMIFVNMTLPT